MAFCEIEPYCRQVLAKHWPQIRIFKDVRALTGEQVRSINVICGGFPCQDISLAGKGAGLAGKRSGLWKEFLRLIDEVGPRWAIIENVPALRSRGLSVVMQNLSEIGYDAEWHCIPASYVGAHHRRDRIWIIAYPNDSRRTARPNRGGWETGANLSRRSAGPIMADAESGLQRPGLCKSEKISHRPEFGYSRRNDANTNCIDDDDRRFGAGQIRRERSKAPRLSDGKSDIPDNGRRSSEGPRPEICGRSEPFRWLPEPDVGRVANGVPSRVDRLKGLGNAVIPQIPEIIGRAILEAEGMNYETR